MTIELTLPWPPRELSPNARLHWSKVAVAKRKYRAACWALTLNASPSFIPQKSDSKLRVHLLFVAPDRRSYDLDGLLSRMKSGLDGVADALKVNDKRFRPSIDISDDIGGMVKVRIEEVICES